MARILIFCLVVTAASSVLRAADPINIIYHPVAAVDIPIEGSPLVDYPALEFNYPIVAPARPFVTVQVNYSTILDASKAAVILGTPTPDEVRAGVNAFVFQP